MTGHGKINLKYFFSIVLTDPRYYLLILNRGLSRVNRNILVWVYSNQNISNPRVDFLCIEALLKLAYKCILSQVFDARKVVAHVVHNGEFPFDRKPFGATKTQGKPRY